MSRWKCRCLRQLAVGETATFSFDFSLTIPRSGSGRFGRESDITAIGNFFPIAQIFKNGDWTRYKYTDTETLSSPKPLTSKSRLLLTNAPPTTIVAHSGELVARDGPRWVLRGRSIRDFALCISHRYEATSEQVGGTSVSVFYLPEHEAAGRQMLQTGVGLLRWANERLGTYPYPSLHIAESPGLEGSGQEYPNLALVGLGSADGPGLQGSYLAYLVAHELIHQWFYGLLGNDQVTEPWLDEGVTVHLSYMFVKSTTPAVYEAMWTGLAKSYHDAVVDSGYSPPIDSSIYDYKDDNQYFALMYRKSALFLEEVRSHMGDTAYLAMLKDFGAEHRFGIATTREFLLFAASRYGAGFEALANRYFSPEAMKALQPPTPTVAPAPTSALTAVSVAAVVTVAPTSTTLADPPATPESSPAPTAVAIPVDEIAEPSPTATSAESGERIDRVADADLDTLALEMPTPPAVATVIVASTVERQYLIDAPVAGLLGLLVGLTAGFVLGGRRARRRRW